MKALRYFLMATAVAGFATSANAQVTVGEVENGTYYTDENCMWYDFRVKADDPFDKEYNKYTAYEGEPDNSIENGWLLGYPSKDNGCQITWDKEKGILRATASVQPWSDNGTSAIQIKPGTPQLRYNTQAYPIIAVKFTHLPVCGEGGWRDGKVETDERMYGGTRLHVVERAATALSGINSDFWLRIPRNQADADHMASYKEDFVDDWLDIYSPNEQDSVYIFDLRGAVARNHHGFKISTRTDAVMDFYLYSFDVAEGDYMEVEWVRSFKDAYDVYDYADGLYDVTSIANANILPVDVVSENGKIVVKGMSDVTIEVFNYLGQSVAVAQGSAVDAPAGSYIVRVSAAEGTKTVKLIHK